MKVLLDTQAKGHNSRLHGEKCPKKTHRITWRVNEGVDLLWKTKTLENLEERVLTTRK